MLETRWTEFDEDAYQAERKQVGNLDRLDEPAPEAVLPAGTGQFGENAEAVLDELRAAHPDDLFKGSLSSGPSDGVHVRFHDPIDPRDLEVDGCRVQCHLYDPNALAAAERT